MSEATPEAAPQETAESQNVEQPQGDETDWKAEARKWEQRAKDNHRAASELEKQRKASMTEAERAVVEAREQGRTAAVQEYGRRLATSEIRAEAAAAGAEVGGVFDYLDLARFVGEDGEPDAKAIKTFVATLPRKTEVPPSFDGGTRTPAPTSGPGMSQLIRAAAGRA